MMAGACLAATVNLVWILRPVLFFTTAVVVATAVVMAPIDNTTDSTTLNPLLKASLSTAKPVGNSSMLWFTSDMLAVTNTSAASSSSPATPMTSSPTTTTSSTVINVTVMVTKPTSEISQSTSNLPSQPVTSAPHVTKERETVPTSSPDVVSTQLPVTLSSSVPNVTSTGSSISIPITTAAVVRLTSTDSVASVGNVTVTNSIAVSPSGTTNTVATVTSSGASRGTFFNVTSTSSSPTVEMSTAVTLAGCLSSPCENNGTCVDGPSNYSCVCESSLIDLRAVSGDPRSLYKVGFNGSNCENLINPCLYEPPICQSGGICHPINDTEMYGFMCFCPNYRSYSTGRFCELNTTYCEVKATLCANGGTCINKPHGYECACPPGYTGSNCSVNIDECQSMPCPYNGTCHDLVNGYRCLCASGSDIVNCDCLSGPCQNGGRCIDGPTPDSHQCDCSGTGHEGLACELEIAKCNSSSCQHGSTCVDNLQNFTCICAAGYTGVYCETIVDPCQSSPCQNNGTCREGTNVSSAATGYHNASYYDCHCLPGFTGSRCELDVDECISLPCQNNGTCVNSNGTFACQCATGYRGSLCETRIDLCSELGPCRNDATCRNLVGDDYECVCNDSSSTRFGGRNCSVVLTGCLGNACANGALCQPVLVDEDTNVQNYTCDCAPGYYGSLCTVSTSVTFEDTNAWILYSNVVSAPVAAVGLQFRTTVSDAVLIALTSGQQSSNRSVVVSLTAGYQLLVVSYENGTVVSAVTVHTPHRSSLTDANWYGVELALSSTTLSTVCLDHPDCPGRCCSSMPSLSETVELVYIGQGMTGVSGYVGCMRDVHVGSVWLTPVWLASNATSSKHVSANCSRSAQCDQLTSCSNRGDCVDMWTSFTCSCRRPYYGSTCSNVAEAATFGLSGQTSFAKFVLPDEVQDSLRTSVDVSFFIRTRRPHGLVVYVGPDQTSTESIIPEYMIVELVGDGFKVSMKTGSESLTQLVDGKIYDGQQHFVNIALNYSWLSVRIDESINQFQIGIDAKLSPTVLYVGGMPVPLSSSRRKRDVSTDGFSGTLQDVRLNGALAVFSAQNVSSTGGKELVLLQVNSTSNLAEGEQTDDICALEQPCFNNGSCTNVFYNDYSCRCTNRYRGRTCSEPSYCYDSPCPSGSQCHSLTDGFLCAAPATFNGNSTFIQYVVVPLPSPGVQDIPVVTITLAMRTRITNGSLLTLLTPSRHFISLQVLNESVVVQHDLTSYGGVSSISSFPVSVSDGTWHSIVVHLSPVNSTLLVDQHVVTSAEKPESSLLDELFNNSVNVTVGYSSLNGFYKGCLSSLEIGGLLLPLSEGFKNDTAVNQFTVVDKQDVTDGCHSDEVCSLAVCANNGTCVDMWNSFVCHCPVGYNGTNCELNVDECATAGMGCQNGGTCIDGVASYGCVCPVGFTGLRCDVNVDECASSPCQNNGTCSDDVGGYQCTCAADYTGTYCEVDLQANCDAQPCLNNATCIPVNTSYVNVETYRCSCGTGYTGERCEISLDPCLNNTCQNSARCQPVAANSYECNCTGTGYEGQMCDVDVDECQQSLCRNGAVCTNVPGNFTCHCTVGFTGATCAVPVCTSEICMNGGTCTVSGNQWNCSCPQFFNGSRCELKVGSACDNAQCHPMSNCTETGSNYTCHCPPGMTGIHCDEDIDECLLSPGVAPRCLNGADCVNTNGSYTCQCLDGYDGSDCSCGPSNCSMHGRCVWLTSSAGHASFRCECYNGYTGSSCESPPVIAAVNNSFSPATIGLIVGVIGGVCCLVIVIEVMTDAIDMMAVTMCLLAKKKRAMHGSYSPSRQEMSGSRIDYGSTFKVPPEERLI